MALRRAFDTAKANPSVLKLKNGRSLYYNEYGASNGFPIVHFHGNFMSRLEPVAVHEIALKNDIKLICADRPGSGLSTINPNMTYATFALDIEELLYALNIKENEFGFSGYSQGGSYVLANLYYLTHWKPQFGALISAVAHYKSNEFDEKDVDDTINNSPLLKLVGNLVVNYPKMFSMSNKITDYMVKYAPSMFRKWTQYPKLSAFGVCESDHDILKSERGEILFFENMEYSFNKYGTKGWDQMLNMQFNQWGFNLSDIDLTNTKILSYHGDYDELVPLKWQQLIADKLGYKVNVFNKYGHMMVYDDNVITQIFDDINCNIRR